MPHKNMRHLIFLHLLKNNPLRREDIKVVLGALKYFEPQTRSRNNYTLIILTNDFFASKIKRLKSIPVIEF